MKILHVSAGGERGGLEVVLLNILRCTDRSRFLPQVALLDDGPFVKDLQDTGTRIHVMRAGRVRDILKGRKAIARTVRIIRTEGIDLVHTHNAKAHLYGGVAALVAGVPSLYHLHGVPRFTATRDGIVSLLSVVVPATRMVACSTYVAREFGRNWLSRQQPVVVHNGLVLPVSSAGNSRAIREEFGIPEGAAIVVMATRLQRWKGVHVFLDAAALVAGHYPQVYFIIVGGTLFGLERDYPVQLKDQVERLSLGQVVRFVGFQSDVRPFYLAADIVVHSAIEPEPFGMVLLEASACGKPVIASDSGGPPEIIENGVTGLLVQPNNATRLAQAILGLLCDPELRNRMGRAGAVRVLQFFTAERMVQQIQSLYEALGRYSEVSV